MPSITAEPKRRPRPKTHVYSLHLLARQIGQLHSLRETTGIAVAEQIRRGVDLWLKQHEAL